MKTTIRCYKYSPTDDPFLTIEAKTADEMIEKLADKISWRDYPNDIFVKIGSDPCIMYNPMLCIFKDWNGMRFVDISKERVALYYF